jgi:hypothetical protein
MNFTDTGGLERRRVDVSVDDGAKLRGFFILMLALDVLLVVTVEIFRCLNFIF